MSKTQQDATKAESISKKLIPAYFLLNRYTVTVFNLMLMLLLGLALKDLVTMLLSSKQEVEEMLKIVGGTGTIIVTYGIVLEERESLMHIFGCYPKHKTPRQALTDQICSDGGILLLVIGLLVEVLVQLIEIPDSIVDTEGHEQIVFMVGGFLLTVTLLHFAVFCYKLLTLKHKQRDQGNQNGQGNQGTQSNQNGQGDQKYPETGQSKEVRQ